ncbi:MAG: mannonate dehydratase [Verrucomicrobia bacterium]|nr:mannonate dehydratase [Verrucomicrobiota bacterium]
MKLGFGLYRHQLNEAHYRFARQCGATHVVVHLVDYFGATDKDNQPVGGDVGWGRAGGSDPFWEPEALARLKADLARHDLVLEAVENFDPAHWYDVLLDGPRRDEQVAHLCRLIQNVGAASIPLIGYNFSLAGVAGRVSGNFARGGAESVGMNGVIDQTPIPDGMIWNMVYDPEAAGKPHAPASTDAFWDRLGRFLNDVLPVAEQAGVRLAAHPDDPPVERLRGQPRLVNQPSLYQKLIDLNPGPSNALELCLGSLAEMTEGGVYEWTRHYAEAGRIGYIHFRNVRGQVPNYHEVFIDEGDLDMRVIVRLLRESGFDGVLIPDHTPKMSAPGPLHAGMAFAMGYMKALLGETA